MWLRDLSYVIMDLIEDSPEAHCHREEANKGFGQFFDNLSWAFARFVSTNS
jgi:hypothetical protein